MTPVPAKYVGHGLLLFSCCGWLTSVAWIPIQKVQWSSLSNASRSILRLPFLLPWHVSHLKALPFQRVPALNSRWRDMQKSILQRPHLAISTAAYIFFQLEADRSLRATWWNPEFMHLPDFWFLLLVTGIVSLVLLSMWRWQSLVGLQPVAAVTSEIIQMHPPGLSLLTSAFGLDSQAQYWKGSSCSWSKGTHRLLALKETRIWEPLTCPPEDPTAFGWTTQPARWEQSCF